MENITPAQTNIPHQPVTHHTGQAAQFIVLQIKSGQENEQKVLNLLTNIEEILSSVKEKDPAKDLQLVIAIGSKAWDRLFPNQPRPANLREFKQLEGSKHKAPATEGDILLHIRAETMDMCMQLNMQIMQNLQGAVTALDETHGFKYFDARSMIGFVDGTENPEGAEALQAALVGEEDEEFAGSSYAIVQKYIHDMSAWNNLSISEQEKVIGRTKEENIELSDEEKPTNSHIALNIIEDENGEELAIMRANLPYAEPSKGIYGTYFIGYAKDPAIIEKMLNNMFIGSPEGNYDRLLDFSRPITGTLFFVPKIAKLREIIKKASEAQKQEETEKSKEPNEENEANSGQIKIGSLKGQPQR